MTVSLAYNLNKQAVEFIILELRKFFTFPILAPYDTLLPKGFWDDKLDVTYKESAPGVPSGPMQIVNEEPLDDRIFTGIIVTGLSGGMLPMGFGQRGSKSVTTIEPLPTTVVPVRVAATGPGDLATDFDNGSIWDGVTLVTDDRILLMFQTNATENGVYVVPASGIAARSTDFNNGNQFLLDTAINVTSGKILGGRQFVQITDQPIVLGTTDIQYEELEFDERIETYEPTITFGIRAKSTAQRDRIVDTLIVAISNQLLVRGQLEAKDIIFQPTAPGFIRNNGYSEETIPQGSGLQMVYKCDLSSTLWLQWNYRTVVEADIAMKIDAIDTVN